MNTNSLNFSQPPLICVVARIDITPLLGLEKHIPDIQSTLRSNGYPDYRKGTHNSIQIDGHSGEIVKSEQEDKHFFWNIEKSVLFTLEQQSVSIHFSRYKTFSESKKHIEIILNTIEEFIPAITTKSISLRYVDHISMDGDQNAAAYVSSSLLGMYSYGDVLRHASVSETSLSTASKSHLIIRCSITPNGNKLPPDLANSPIEWKELLATPTAFITLDTIHTKNMLSQGAHSATSIINEFSSLREPLNAIFLEVTTDHAREQWK